MRKLRIIIAISIVVFSLLLALIWICQFDNSLTEEDKQYISLLLEEFEIEHLPKERTFEQEVAFIAALQEAITEDRTNKGIPQNSLRNPKNYYLSRQGVCYDISYLMEKIFMANGFEIRHAYILLKNGQDNFCKLLLSEGALSHAVSEVKTEKGWLVVEPLVPYTSIYNNKPRDLKWLKKNRKKYKAKYEGESLPLLLKRDYYFIYGLYSRHGRFYPPYNAIPDYRFKQLFYNL
jgi:hypothetical protein